MLRCTFFIFFLLTSNINAEETKGGMPQLNPESFTSQVFWLIILFIILFLLNHYFFIPKLQNIRKQREDTIDEQLKEAERINDSMNALIEKMNKDLDEAKTAQNSLLKKVFNENKDKLDSKVLKINEEFEQKKKKLENDIEKNKNLILAKFPSLCISLSDNLYEKIMGEKTKGNIDEFNKSLGDSK